MRLCGCRKRAKARRALEDAVASGDPAELQRALEQAKAAKLHQSCTQLRVARAARANADTMSTNILQLLAAASTSDDLAIVKAALSCASAAHMDQRCAELRAAEVRRAKLQAVEALYLAASSGALVELQNALTQAAALQVEGDCSAMRVAKLAFAKADLRRATHSGIRLNLERAIEQARLTSMDDEITEMREAQVALALALQNDAKQALRDATESGNLPQLEAALRQAIAAKVDDSTTDLKAAEEAKLAHAPVSLVVKALASVDGAAVLKMAKPEDLPEEMLLQQEIMSVPGGIDCFHCGGSGSLFTRRKRRLEDAINAARVGIDFEATQAAGAENSSTAPGAGGNDQAEGSVLQAVADDRGAADVGMDDVILSMQLPPHVEHQNSDGFSTIPAEQAMWLFEDGAGGWGIFHEAMAEKLEEAWWEGVGAILQVKGPRFTYQVDLDTMVQLNLQTGRERHVQRLALDEDFEPALLEGVHEAFTNEVVEFPRMPEEGDAAAALGTSEGSTGTCLAFNFAQQIEPSTDSSLQHEPKGLVLHEGLEEDATESDMPQALERLGVFASMQSLDDFLPDRPNADQDSGKDRADAASSAEITTDLAQQPTRQCWVCRGTGKTSKWLSGFQTNQLTSSDDHPCLVCYGESQYGLSVECDHYYCRDCISSSLEAILNTGQFPAFCPQCRAEALGTPEVGRIEDVALSFLVQREVVSSDFFFRFSRQQQASEVPGTEDAFECPARCGRFLLQNDPSYGSGFGAPFTVGRTVALRLGECPCGARVCGLCHQEVFRRSEGFTHSCPEEERPVLPSDPETLKLLGQIGKKCPKCGIFIQKNEGCQKMTCGTKAHGRLVDILRNGGCGCGFDWSTLKVVDDNYTDLDDVRKNGRLITARQIPGHPKCARPECRFFKTVDDLFESTSKQAKSGGGEYCCDMCRRGPSGSHSKLCHQIRFFLPPLPPAPHDADG